MTFRTEYFPQAAADPLDPERPVTLLGSCFSAEIGRRMRRSLWDARINPCGTLFNPLSILNVVRLAAEGGDGAESVFDAGGYWASRLMDSSTAGLTREEAVARTREAFLNLRESIAVSDTLILTFGTARIYIFDATGECAGNCHKLPSALFTRRLMGVEETSRTILETIRLARLINPDIRTILTVSPVRHLKDGFHGNTVSKATLHLAIEGILASAGSVKENIAYFPAFEILNDDLRDYRFYASDMAHPSPEGADYVWEKFRLATLDEKGRSILDRGFALSLRSSHRPLIPGTPAAMKFAEETRRLIREFLLVHPGMIAPDSIQI